MSAKKMVKDTTVDTTVASYPYSLDIIGNSAANIQNCRLPISIEKRIINKNIERYGYHRILIFISTN
jgi:hypothetical protein